LSDKDKKNVLRFLDQAIRFRDTVALSNFLLSDSIFILENRYRGRGLITFEIYDEISAGMVEYPKLKQIDTILSKMTDAGFYSPLRSIADII